MSAFLPRFDQLPDELPVFPLPGVLLLPGGELPLRIFEPRYLAMFDDALKTHRLIGMIQPKTERAQNGDEARKKTLDAVYALGCAGRITAFTETDDGHYTIDLTGIARFRVREELTGDTPYRRVRSDFGDFRGDLEEAARPPEEGDKAETQRVTPQMLSTMRRYFEYQKIEADLESIAKAPVRQLVTALAMSCPFDTAEKQALLEAEDANARTDVLLSLMEMAAVGTGGATNLN